jgi:hypothetical protein
VHLQAQAATLDTLFWNATLRSDHSGAAHACASTRTGVQVGPVDGDETSFVFSAGLVVLSLNGNAFTDEGLLSISRALRKNSWLLGNLIHSIVTLF